MDNDTFRTLAPSDHKAWPDLLTSMGWKIESILPWEPSSLNMSFVIAADSGVRIPVFFMNFMWMGEDDDALANTFFSTIEKFSRVSGLDILVLNKFVLLEEFDALKGVSFSVSGRFFFNGKWTDIYLNRSCDVSTLFIQARRVEGELPSVSLSDNDQEVCKYICERQGAAMGVTPG